VIAPSENASLSVKCRLLIQALAIGVAACLLAPAHAAPPEAPPQASLQVLHWWTSASERRAANAIAARLADENVEWKDAAIPGGAGLGAGKVLKSRVLARDAPEVTQIIGVSIGEWAEMGLLLELDQVAAAGNWNSVLFPAIQALVQHRRHVVAAPLGIHRINTLFYHRKLLARLNLAPPKTWAELEHAALTLKAAGVMPLAQSSEPWQVATLFENLVLAGGGPDYHRELFMHHSARAVADQRLIEALERLRTLKGWMSKPVLERPWTDVVRQLAKGEAAMLVMGDWAKGELNEWGYATDDTFGCIPMPGTGRYHLYSVDTLTMFASDSSHVQAQEKLARLVATPALQAEYNLAKGSVPVRRDADLSRMDSCARASWSAFAQGAALQAPSLVHRMATDEASKDAIIAEIHRYFMDDTVSPAQAQRRLGAMLRALHAKSRG
jgi:glucose/mannose transport system substrate-binding protein